MSHFSFQVRTHFARPDWKKVFNKVAAKHPCSTVGKNTPHLIHQTCEYQSLFATGILIFPYHQLLLVTGSPKNKHPGQKTNTSKAY